MSKRFFASTQFFFQKHSFRGPHSFNAGTYNSNDFFFKGIRIASRPAISFSRYLPGFDGATLEFRDFTTIDEAYDFCRDFMITLATRVSSQGAAILFSTTLQNHDFSDGLWQPMPGINVLNSSQPDFNTVYSELDAETQYPSTPGDWLHDTMSTAPILRDEELEPALKAYGIACGTTMPESRLLNLFAALEALAGTTMENKDLTNRINLFQNKVMNDPNYSTNERDLLKILNGKKQKSRKVAVEELLKNVVADEALVKQLNLAYKARGAYAHSAKSHEEIVAMTNVVESLVITAFSDRIRHAKFSSSPALREL